MSPASVRPATRHLVRGDLELKLGVGWVDRHQDEAGVEGGVEMTECSLTRSELEQDPASTRDIISVEEGLRLDQQRSAGSCSSAASGSPAPG